MMKASEPRIGDHDRGRRRLPLNCPMNRSVLLKRIVNPVFMVVGHVIADEPPQMAFIQCNDMIEKLAAAASDPAFRDPVLPGRLNTGALRRQPC